MKAGSPDTTRARPGNRLTIDRCRNRGGRWASRPDNHARVLDRTPTWPGDHSTRTGTTSVWALVARRSARRFCKATGGRPRGSCTTSTTSLVLARLESHSSTRRSSTSEVTAASTNVVSATPVGKPPTGALLDGGVTLVCRALRQADRRGFRHWVAAEDESRTVPSVADDPKFNPN